MSFVNKCTNIPHDTLLKTDLFHFYIYDILSNFTFVINALGCAVESYLVALIIVYF